MIGKFNNGNAHKLEPEKSALLPYIQDVYALETQIIQTLACFIEQARELKSYPDFEVRLHKLWRS